MAALQAGTVVDMSMTVAVSGLSLPERPASSLQQVQYM